MFKQKKFLSIALILCLVSAVSFASIGVKENGTSVSQVSDINLTYATGTTVTNGSGQVTIPVLDSSLVAAGTANGGAVSMASNESAVPVTYAFVRKAIANDAAYDAGTLAAGKPGQLLTIYITTLSGGSRTFTLTPTTKTGFSSLAFNAVADSATLLYVDSTTGWVLVASNSVTVN